MLPAVLSESAKRTALLSVKRMVTVDNVGVPFALNQRPELLENDWQLSQMLKMGTKKQETLLGFLFFVLSNLEFLAPILFPCFT